MSPPAVSKLAFIRSVVTAICSLATGADAGAGAAGAAATPPVADGIADADAGVGVADGAATRAGGGPNSVGWPLCRLHDSQRKNSEAMKMPQSRVRRMSVMTAIEKTPGRARRDREAK